MRPKYRYTDKQALQLAVLAAIQGWIDDAFEGMTVREAVVDFFEQDILGLPDKQTERISEALESGKGNKIWRTVSRMINVARRDLMKQENAIHRLAREVARVSRRTSRRLCKSCEAAITQTDIAAGACTQCGARIKKTSDVVRKKTRRG